MGKDEVINWPRIGCGCILLSRKHPGKALYGLRKGSHGAGKWALPGGKLDLDEDALELCIQREIEEEVGIHLPLESIEFVTMSNDPRLDGDIHKHFVTCLFKAIIPDDAVVRNLEPHKCEGWEWTSYEKLLEYEREGALFVPMIHLLETNAVDNSFWSRDVAWTKSPLKLAFEWCISVFYNPLAVCVALLVLEMCLCSLVIRKVPYTEIDWKAYMQEVGGYLSGERNYELMRGDTGPLVYPAGFLYIFSLLHHVTDAGTNIYLGQCIFAGLYLLNLAVVMCLYHRVWACKQRYHSTTPQWRRLQATFSFSTANYSHGISSSVPLWGWGLLVLSKRIHSLYVLRMFNDCVAVFCGYLSLWLFTLPLSNTSTNTSTWLGGGGGGKISESEGRGIVSGRYRLGCAIYSIGVGVKMNMLLWAPGLLLVLLLALGVKETIVCLCVCGLVQVLLGLPFLATFPYQYLHKAFELNRVFKYEWTVNYKFLTDAQFTSPFLSGGLLVGTVLTFTLFGIKWARGCHAALISTTTTTTTTTTATTTTMHRDRGRDRDRDNVAAKGGTKRGALRSRGKRKDHNDEKNAVEPLSLSSTPPVLAPWHAPRGRILSAPFVLVTIFTSNFIGLAFSRTLHYQFYSWYFHSLPLLLWHALADTVQIVSPLSLFRMDNGKDSIGAVLAVAMLMTIEACFNIFPATPASSTALQGCHLLLLVALYCAPVPAPTTTTTTTTTTHDDDDDDN